MKVLVQKYRINGKLYGEAYSHIQNLEPGTIVESVLVIEENEEDEEPEVEKK